MFKPSVTGLAVLALKVRQFGPIRKARLQRGFEEKGGELVEKIKAATPVRKGSLRASVRVEAAKKYPGVVIIAGGTAATSRGPGLDEALLTEYGTRKEPAEPFFWPTIAGEEAPIRQGLAEDVKGDD